MTLPLTPYDEYPYRSYPIEWSAPERLALTSLLHGGPRLRVDEPYRVLEIGCGDGANLVPLAYYRTHASFTGIDAAATRIDVAKRKQVQLGLRNLALHACDVRQAADLLNGEFDVIIAHGVFSWVPTDARDALLQLCAARLRAGGLLYLNYNARPGWNVRGLIREFLLTQTKQARSLNERTELARALSVRMAEHLHGADHPYSLLLASEFRFVSECPASHTAHEYLSADNQAYSRLEFLALAASYGLSYVADADFDRRAGRIPEQLPAVLSRLQLTEALDEAADLLLYRQLHSPVLTRAHSPRRAPSISEFTHLRVTSQLSRLTVADGAPSFGHPSGAEVTVTAPSLALGLDELGRIWPRHRSVGGLFGRVTRDLCEDLTLLHRQGLLELRLPITDERVPQPTSLHALERENGYVTSATHVVVHSPDR